MVIVKSLIGAGMAKIAAEIRKHLFQGDALLHPDIHPFDNKSVAKTMYCRSFVTINCKRRLIPSVTKNHINGHNWKGSFRISPWEKPFSSAFVSGNYFVMIQQKKLFHIRRQINQSIFMALGLHDPECPTIQIHVLVFEQTGFWNPQSATVY